MTVIFHNGSGYDIPILYTTLCRRTNKRIQPIYRGAKHGYALTKDVEAFSGVRLAPGTLYEALSRLEGQGFIEALESQDRRRPYRLTAGGAAALRAHLDDQRRVADVGLRRLARSWGSS